MFLFLVLVFVKNAPEEAQSGTGSIVPVQPLETARSSTTYHTLHVKRTRQLRSRRTRQSPTHRFHVPSLFPSSRAFCKDHPSVGAAEAVRRDWVEPLLVAQLKRPVSRLEEHEASQLELQCPCRARALSMPTLLHQLEAACVRSCTERTTAFTNPWNGATNLEEPCARYPRAVFSTAVLTWWEFIVSEDCGVDSPRPFAPVLPRHQAVCRTGRVCTRVDSPSSGFRSHACVSCHIAQALGAR